MIKGVNRQIIEVSDTGSAYFERALLIVRANCADADTAMLHDEAGRLVRSAGAFAGLRLNRPGGAPSQARPEGAPEPPAAVEPGMPAM